MDRILPLRRALLANAVFSTLSGATMIFFPAHVGAWLCYQFPILFQIVGIGLLMFASAIIVQATRKRVSTFYALFTSAADFFWVIGSIALVAVFSYLFSSFGQMLILGIAAVVLFFGIWQVWAAAFAHKIKHSGEYRHCIIVETNASAPAMWSIVGNMGEIAQYMPSLQRSMIVDDKKPSVGAVRVCADRSGKEWSEECVAFAEGQSFAVRFVSEAPDFPFPATTMRGGWEVIPTEHGSHVKVWWELAPKSPFLAPILLPVLAHQIDRDFPTIIHRMAQAAVGTESTQGKQSQTTAFAQLLPAFC